jgi:thymidylate synthase (FAD)
MAHSHVTEAEAILDRELPVLDHGFVRLVDYLGSDERIVQAARVSYGDGTKSYRADRGLIRYLLRNEHTSPFEQVNFTFHLKMPVFVARQWIRHRTARVNEISGRYSVLKEEFYLPESEVIAVQSADNKQGRADAPVDVATASRVRDALAAGQKAAYRTYQELLDAGIAREIARIALPLSLYTEFYWQMDLHNLFRFLTLRLDEHAQYEIRVYARVLLDIAGKVCPIACEAYREYVAASVRFSAGEVEAIQNLAAGAPPGLDGPDLERFTAKITKAGNRGAS